MPPEQIHNEVLDGRDKQAHSAKQKQEAQQKFEKSRESVHAVDDLVHQLEDQADSRIEGSGIESDEGLSEAFEKVEDKQDDVRPARARQPIAQNGKPRRSLKDLFKNPRGREEYIAAMEEKIKKNLGSDTPQSYV